MRFSPLLEKLVESLRFLPGVGPKTAQRMALQLLTRGRDNGRRLAEHLQEAMDKIGHCAFCRIFSETTHCEICMSHLRDRSVLCIVENPIDVAAIEQTAIFKGRYFVLLGKLSPLDGIGPDEIGIELLQSHFKTGEIKEVILATNPTVEGEATAHYISQLAKQSQIEVSRIAHGVPIGSELEYIDLSTLARALSDRDII